MNSLASRLKIFSLVAVLAAGLSGCAANDNPGRLSLSLADASTALYKAVYVTILEVGVHFGEDPADLWTTVGAPAKTYNLLDLVNGVREDLGLADLVSGHYTQLRLILGDISDGGVNILSVVHPYANYVIDTSNQYHELKIPSGMQTGIKIVQGFDINQNQTTELILDFDAARSVVVAGQSGKYLLKPTIQVLGTALAAIVNGTVTNAADQADVEGALVSAQVYDPATADVKDQVVVETSTISDSAGGYKLFIAAGAYNLVASKEGFAPFPVALTVAADSTSTQDFALTAAATGTLTGAVTIAGADAETFATISIRQSIMLGTSNVVIEVMSMNVASGGAYSAVLPAGNYTVISSTAGKLTQQANAAVTAGVPKTLDISF